MPAAGTCLRSGAAFRTLGTSMEVLMTRNERKRRRRVERVLLAGIVLCLLAMAVVIRL